MVRKNKEIRELSKQKNIPLWMIAKALGVSDTTFSKWLRDEFPVTMKNKIKAIVNDLSEKGA